ncbi:MAG: thiamine phosphate synthase [Bacteroidetes bacterium]|nr:thiamine phosphate synthase [Bacteroidota bacterium]
MKIIVISSQNQITNEHYVIEKLFDNGLEYFHLRKPAFSRSEMEKYINKIPEDYRKRVMIHSHPELINKYNLKGIHFNRRNPFDIELFDKEKNNILFSQSVHSLKEFETIVPELNYVILSPIFDSYSKKRYKSKFSKEQLKEFLSNYKKKNVLMCSSVQVFTNTRTHEHTNTTVDVIALGGIDKNKIAEAYELGFDGIALLGTLWNYFEKTRDIDKIIEKFISIKEKCAQVLECSGVHEHMDTLTHEHLNTI